jgi:hypothetical protein
MKTIQSLRKHHYLKTVSIFLIAVILIAGVVSCEGEPEVKPLQHFEGYNIDIVNMPYIGQTVEVGDKFGNWTATVGWGMGFSNPAEKTYNVVTEGILDEVFHGMGFGLEDLEPGPGFWQVTVDNQFRTEELTVYGPIALSVPTEKNSLGEPQGYNCYLAYEVIDPSRLDVYVDLWDQFDPPGIKQNVLVTQPKNFATPAWMRYGGNLTSIVNQDDYSVGYFFHDPSAAIEKNEIEVTNVFGQWTVNVTEQQEGALSVPSTMTQWSLIEPPLDHFKFYQKDMGTIPLVGQTVDLEDQFGNLTATVGSAWAFGNPVQKAVNEIAAWELWPISHPDYHLMLYTLEGIVPTEGPWQVTVDNQFGTQYLTVYGPVGLAVPTHKLVPGVHDPPEGLGYFLCYNLTSGDIVPPITVDLVDELTTYPDNDFVVTDTLLFANPVKIMYDDNTIDPVYLDDDHDHLVFYKGDFNYYVYPDPASHEVQISNPFTSCTFTVWQEVEAILAVPSEKLSVTPLD